MVIPGKKRGMKLKPGWWGTSDLSVTLSNGMISQVGQKVDLKIPETITAIAGLAGTVAGVAVKDTGATSICEPPAALYKIDSDGNVTDIVTTFGTTRTPGAVTQ